MLIRLESRDYTEIAEAIYDSYNDRGIVYISCGDTEVHIEYEKEVIYDSWCNADGTHDVLLCEINIASVYHSDLSVEYDEDKIVEEFKNFVFR